MKLILLMMILMMILMMMVGAGTSILSKFPAAVKIKFKSYGMAVPRVLFSICSVCFLFFLTRRVSCCYLFGHFSISKQYVLIKNCIFWKYVPADFDLKIVHRKLLGIFFPLVNPLKFLRIPKESSS